MLDVIPVANMPVSTRQWSRVYAIMYTVYVLVGLGVRFSGWMHDDALVFVQASRRVLDGSFDLYSILRTPFIAPPLGTTYAYTPLLAILITPFVAIVDAFRLGNIWAMKAIGIPLLLIDVLAMQQLRRLARMYRPNVDERLLFWGIGVSLFVTSFWLVTAYKSHIEGMVLLFLLLALRFLPINLLLSGLCAGLALSAKHTTALPCLIPVGLVLLTYGLPIGPSQGGNHSRLLAQRLQNIMVWGVAALSVFVVLMLPPILRNPSAVYYAFVTQGARIVILGSGLPRWIDYLSQAKLNQADYAFVHERLVSYSNLALLAGAILLTATLIWWTSRQGRSIGLNDTRLLGLVALGAVIYVILAKWVSDSYYQMPLALVLLWDVVRVSRTEQAPGSQDIHFPWIGIGAALAFRSITQFGSATFPEIGKFVAPDVMNAMLLLLFVTLAVLIVRWTLSSTSSNSTSAVRN